MWSYIIHVILLFALIVLLFKFNSAGRYWIKFSSFFIISCISATVPIPIMLLNPRSSKNALIPAAGLRASCKLLGLTTSVEGKENIVQDSGCVVLINHQSMLDLIVLANLWPCMDNCTVISKKEIFYLQPFGLASWLWGTIFIDRVDAKRAQEAVNKTGDTIRTKKAKLLMFPEGTRGCGDKLLPFKKGAFHVALASKCPIQPVVVSKYTFLGKQRFDDGHITIKILPKINTKDYKKDELPKLMDQVHQVMASHMDLLSKNNAESVNNNDDIKNQN